MPEDVTDRRCCHKCHKTVTGKKKLSKCSRCHSITYCSRKCQGQDWPRHRQFCIPVMVTEIPGKGKGLVASKDFKKGQVIFKETVAINVHAPSDIVPLQELKEQITRLSEEQKNKFYNLTAEGNFNQAQEVAALREKCLLELDIFSSNCLTKDIVFSNRPVTGAGENSFLFITLSLLNHSCAPNVYLDDCDGSGHEVKVIATKAISKGEEVTHCYTRGFMTSSEMKTEIQDNFSFDCKCGVCSGAIPHQDKIISEITSTFSSVLSQSPDLVYQKKKKEWRDEAAQLGRIAHITKQLYVGCFSDKLKVYVQFVFASQMAREPIRLRKAMDLLKEDYFMLGLMETSLVVYYEILEAWLERWSSEFQSKTNPTKEEIDYFISFFKSR